MKSAKSRLPFAIVSLFAAGLVFGAANKAKQEAPAPACCAKAKEEVKPCAKEGCEKAGKSAEECGKCKEAGQCPALKK